MPHRARERSAHGVSRDIATGLGIALAASLIATAATHYLSGLPLVIAFTGLLLATATTVLMLTHRRSRPMRVSFMTVQPRWHEQVPCYLTVLDRDLRITDCNEIFRRDFGDRIGEHCYLAFKDRDAPCPDCAAQRSFVSGETNSGDETVRTPDGRMIEVVETAAPMADANGEVTAVTVVATDVTESLSLKRELDQTRRDYERLFTAVPCFICVLDRDHQIIEANALYRKEFHANNRSLCYQACKQRTTKCPDCIVDQTFADGETHSNEETLVRRNGERVNVVVHTRPVYGDSGEITAVMEVFTDITEVKNLQRQLTLMGRAVAGMAHRIKNILMGLEGGIFVVNSGLEGDDRESIAEGWEMVERNVHRVSTIVKDLLYCAKDRQPEFRDGVSPAEVVREVYDLYADRLAEEAIELRLELSETSIVGRFDREGLHSLLCNLVSNAVDACRFDPAEGKRLHTITLRCHCDGGGATVLEVADDGAGIPEELNHRVFEDFFSSKGTEGTGIGLLVVQKIAHEHGGKVTFTSAPGAGTTFTVSIPGESDRRSDGGALPADGGANLPVHP